VTIALITNFNIIHKKNAALRVLDVLLKKCCCVHILKIYEDVLKGRVPAENVLFVPFEHLYENVAMAIVLGGDGTILEAAHHAAPLDIPILGINMGHVGYMAELETNELNLLDDVLKGAYRVVEHDMLRAEIIDEKQNVVSSAVALNDVTVGNGGVTRLVDLELCKNGEKLASVRADGVIVSTPTGSTAYSLAAGGPVIDPDIPCFCFTPICPQIPTLKPVVFSNSAVIAIKNVCVRERHLIVTTDGKNNMELLHGQTLRVTKAAVSLKLIRLKKSNFYEKMQEKILNRSLMK